MPAGFVIRPAMPAEEPQLYAIHRAAMEDYVVQTWGPWDDADQQHRFAGSWPDLRLAIEIDGELAGFLDLDEQGPTVDIAALELAPRWQRQGIGSAIIRAVQARAAELERPVTLQVLKVNPARALWERHGFRQVGESETHYQMAWQAGA
ncbi:GNAT family N-acetyltransferase [Tepidiforma flava]|uniref:GNAT family N-acetyltransferase n=1 Tax=Tepidiforma flava TaxID=3004094 RepID=A0ABY7MA85_9CHLR|nr:GNAT family N-acetyltransferase [Tepidiforma flava]WBL37000.1 GNAT family N-acetyltransferase [Tepidiforma flava]